MNANLNYLSIFFLITQVDPQGRNHFDLDVLFDFNYFFKSLCMAVFPKLWNAYHSDSKDNLGWYKDECLYFVGTFILMSIGKI